MQCFIYKSLKKDGLYLYLNKQDDFSSLPEPLLASLGKLTLVMELQLNPQRTLAREDVKKVMSSLESKGFFIQMPPITVPTAVTAANTLIH